MVFILSNEKSPEVAFSLEIVKFLLGVESPTMRAEGEKNPC